MGRHLSNGRWIGTQPKDFSLLDGETGCAFFAPRRDENDRLECKLGRRSHSSTGQRIRAHTELFIVDVSQGAFDGGDPNGEPLVGLGLFEAE